MAHYYAVSPHLEESREHIANSVMEGINRYDKSRWTAVVTD